MPYISWNHCSRHQPAFSPPSYLLLIAWTLWPKCTTDSSSSISDLSEAFWPFFVDKITAYHSAVAQFYAPSDICSIKGVWHECIHALPSWHKDTPWFDISFVEMHPDMLGMLGIDIMQVHIFFSFKYNGIEYWCALVKHLIGVYRAELVSTDLKFSDSLYASDTYCIIVFFMWPCPATFFKVLWSKFQTAITHSFLDGFP